ncbi:MAG TPA: transposase [Desulfobacterales bacterium]|nr:transposase [Desulfobacterales bacterium]
MGAKLSVPEIPEEITPEFIEQLHEVIQDQAAIIQKQAEEIQHLKDEIARLKNQPPRPKIQPSRLEKKKKRRSKSAKGKRPGSKKRKKTANIEIHKVEPVEPEQIPDGSEFRYYRDFVVQDIKLEPYNIRFRLKVYETPDDRFIVGQLPKHLNGKHFGPALIRFILYQYYHCHVTQPLLLEQLDEFDIDISVGQLNNILIENKAFFHREKDRILAVDLEVSSYINVDDTGARHKGQNGYCTHIGNKLFSWFQSTESKSRINFLKLLRAGHSDYCINMDAISYMQSNKMPQYVLKPIIANLQTVFANDLQWDDFLSQNGIVKYRHLQIATEGALIGSIIEHGISQKLVILSDDAGQFNVLLHALCWIHAERSINKVIPFTDQAKKDLNTVRDQIWRLYKGLKQYKENPNSKDKKRLKAIFDKTFTQKTHSTTLNQALKRLYRNKAELLLVLERPDIPLHNNIFENAIREYVKKRKISGSTRSELGRQCRDTFTSLKKTCRKLDVSFWQYLKDRIEEKKLIPNLADLIRQQTLNPG